MNTHHRGIVAALVAGWLIVGAAGLRADVIVVPNDNASAPGASNTFVPLDYGNPIRCQQIFSASQLGGQSGVIT